MPDDSQIRDKLAKIKALFAGATTAGERQAAQAALERVQQRINTTEPLEPFQPFHDFHDPPIEHNFSLKNPWSLRLFLALCRLNAVRHFSGISGIAVVVQILTAHDVVDGIGIRWRRWRWWRRRGDRAWIDV